MEQKEPTLKGLIDDLNQLNNLNNYRFSILGLQLYSEHYVNELVLKEINESAKKEVRTYLSFPQKLRILKKMKILNNETEKILQTLNSIRDTLAHELILSSKEINHKLKSVDLGFKHSWKTKENNKEIVKEINLKEIYKTKIKGKFQQLIISSIIIIAGLHHELLKQNKKQIKEFIEIILEKDKDNNFQPRIIVKEIK
jgi:hypothetical protein